MSRNVIIAASLPATPDKLFDMYLDAEAHAAFTGFPVTIAARAGAPFRAFNDMLSGTIIHVVPKRLIVQTWRSDRSRPRQRSGGRFRRSQPRLGEVLLDAVARSSERGNQTSIRDAGAISDLRELPKLKEGILEPDCQSHPWPAFVKSTLSCL